MPPARSEIVLGILIAEDLIAILILAVLTAAASGARLEAAALARTVGRLAGFLVVLLAVGMLVVPRLVRALVRLGRTETTVVATVGICFAFALLARRMGYSVALGAFLGGALVAESGEAKIIEHRLEPVRDLFAAIFFVSVGMLIDPQVIWTHVGTVLLFSAVVIVGRLVGVTVGAFVAGYGIPTAVQTALSLGQIGEFSFIIAGVGLTFGVTRPFLYPIMVAVSAVTTLLTPFLIRISGLVGALIDRRLPHTLQTYAALYGAWVQGLRATGERKGAWSKIRRRAALLILDAALSAGIVIGGAVASRRLAGWAARAAGVAPAFARTALIAVTLALLVPFVLGAVRTARALAVALATEALPGPGLRRVARPGGGAAAGALGHAPDRHPAGGRRAAGGGDAAVPAAVRRNGDPARLSRAAGPGALAQRRQPARTRPGRGAGPSRGAGGAKWAGRRRRLARVRRSAGPDRAARAGERPYL